MIGPIQIRERGFAPKGMRRMFGNASKEAYRQAGQFFDDHLRDRRFTATHARDAGYKRRKGERLPKGSKQYKRSYTGRKEAKYGHTRPLEFSGDTRRALASGGRVEATKNRALVRYPQARVFSYRHPKSQIRMNEEFRKLLPQEEVDIGQAYDRRLDEQLADPKFASIRNL